VGVRNARRCLQRDRQRVVAKKRTTIRRGEGVPARGSGYKVVPAVRHRPVREPDHAAAIRIHHKAVVAFAIAPEDGER